MRKGLIGCLLSLPLLIFPVTAQAYAQADVTVSGTVTYEGQPFADLDVFMNWPEGEVYLTTDDGGFYSYPNVPAGGWLNIQITPPQATGLATASWSSQNVSGDVTKDFVLQDGHLLSGSVYLPEGGLYHEGGWLRILPYTLSLPDGEYLGTGIDQTGAFAMVAPYDVYVLQFETHTHYSALPTAVDLRSGAATGIRIDLDEIPRNPYDYDPPDASRISFGSPDGLGEATVIGAPGAAMPLAYVLLVNLNSTHQSHTISESDGSFSAKVYAPPGSAIMVKHGLKDEWRWRDIHTGIAEGVNPYPGTIINIPHDHTSAVNKTPFATAGGIDVSVDDSPPNTVGAGWAITGEMGPVVVDGKWTRVMDGKYEKQLTPGLYLGGLNWTQPAIADLDGDGDPELVVGERSGKLVFYPNEGDVNNPSWQFDQADYAGVQVDGSASPTLADVTADNAPDLFVGAGDGQVFIYYNAGTPSAPVWPEAADEVLLAGDGASPALEDLDNDGDLDLIVGHGGGTLYHFENTGSASIPIWRLQSDRYAGIDEGVDSMHPAFIDLDGDGDHDMLLGRCGYVLWYRRGGSATNPSWTRVEDDPVNIGGGSCAISPGIGDWNGDGGSDVVTGEHWGNLRFFASEDVQGSGAGNQPSWSEQDYQIPFELFGDTAPAFSDWDDDGDLDMVMGQAHGSIVQYTNIGSDILPNWRHDGEVITLPWTNHPHPYPAFVDIDDDNDSDLFVGWGDWDGADAGGTLRYYRNDGTAQAPNWNLATTDYGGFNVGGWSTPAFADIDNDGDPDLFIGAADGAITFAENSGTPVSPTWDTPVLLIAAGELGQFSAPAFFDLDEDGDLDILVGLENGSLAYIRNTGTANQPSWEIVSTAYPDINIGHNAVPAAADLDGDGRDDLLIGDGDGGLNYYRNEGPGAPSNPDDTYVPGSLLQISGTMRIHSPTIDESTDLESIGAHAWMELMMLFNEQGHPLAAENNFMSTLLT